MRFLLDTHVVLWASIGSGRLSERVRAILAEGGHDYFVSAVSSFEIATKHRLGKLPEAAILLVNFENQVETAGFQLLPVSSLHARSAGAYPQEHKDPFDRMLAAQAKLDGLTLLSADSKLDSFAVERVW